MQAHPNHESTSKEYADFFAFKGVIGLVVVILALLILFMREYFKFDHRRRSRQDMVLVYTLTEPLPVYKISEPLPAYTV